MDRTEVIQKLKEHEAELKAAGIVHLRLHGSYARGTQVEPLSDVDLIAELEPGRRYTLIDMVRIENRLHELLGVKVDLSPAHMLKEPVRLNAEREAVLAF
jgi:predicted nucleotidyltransferase